MPEVKVEGKNGESRIEINGKFALAVFESGGVWTGGRPGKTVI